MDLSASIRPICSWGRSMRTRKASTTPPPRRKGGENVQIYHKLHPCPSANMSPGETCAVCRRDRGRQVPGDFTRGKELVIFGLRRTGWWSSAICFEDTVRELTRQFVLDGANLLANVTNDGWFLRSAGARQHLENALFRCLSSPAHGAGGEHGRTCFVNRFGWVTQMLLDSKGGQFTRQCCREPSRSRRAAR